jgi:hypothetical protein
MPIVDDRGRVAGRVNLVDAFVAIVVLVLVPVAYGAYLLFRTPTPTLTAINPAQLYQGPSMRVEIQGENLRPFMRVSFNTTQGRTFLIGSTKYAFVDVPDLPPGTYDVVLFDYMQEASRLPKALTILPLAPVPTVEMVVGGSFQGLSDATAAEIKPGLKLPPTGEPLAEVLAVGGSAPALMRLRAGEMNLNVPLAGQREVHATLRVKCYVTSGADGSLRCNIPGPQHNVEVAPGAMPTLPGPHGWVTFQIADVHDTAAPAIAEAHVSLVASPEAAGQMKVGDVDAGPKVAAAGRGATIVAVRTLPGGDNPGRQTAGGAARIVDLTVRVPVERLAAGWAYKDVPVKVGAPFTFETGGYVVQGEVTAVTLPPAASTAAGNR